MGRLSWATSSATMAIRLSSKIWSSLGLSQMMPEVTIFLPVLFMQQFCDPEEMEYPYLKKALDAAGIPHIKLGVDQQMRVIHSFFFPFTLFSSGPRADPKGQNAALRSPQLGVDQQMRDFGQASTAIQAFADVL